MERKKVVSSKLRENEIFRNLNNFRVGILTLAVLGVILVLSTNVNAYSGGGGSGTCYCGNGNTSLGGNATDACVDCTAALNDDANCTNQVNYVGTVNIINYTGTCINNPSNFTNKTLDCQGWTIDGDDLGTDQNPTYGIYLNGKSGNTIKNCIITDFYYGIYLYNYSNNNTLTNNTANSNSQFGIILSSFSNNNTLTNNTANDNAYGIYLYSSSKNNTLTNNTANSNNHAGIYISSNSNFNKILGNKISTNNETGIAISDCDAWGQCYIDWGNSNNTIADNEISNNKIGIFSQNSNSTINRNRVCGNTLLDFNSSAWLSVGDNNSCNSSKADGWNDTGKTGCSYTCCYIPEGGVCTIKTGENCTCMNGAINDNTNCYKEIKLNSSITNWVGTCINNPLNFTNKIFDCQGNTITGDSLGNDYGIYLYGKLLSGNTIKNCIVTGFWMGIHLWDSSNNNISNNTANSNNNSGIYLAHSSNNTLTNNTANNAWDGIYLNHYSNNNILTNNTANNNTYGIETYSSSNNTLTSNTANSNNHGISLSSSSKNNTLINNTASLNSYGISLDSSSNNNILTNNTANSNSYYGILLIYSSNNNTLTNNTANSNSNYGILLIYSSNNNTLTNNTANSNRYGILLGSSSNNTLTNNTAKSNNNMGIYIYHNSNFNKISNNKISNNNETGITISNCDEQRYCLSGNLNNIISNNEISNNKIGIFSQQSNSTINNNYVCGNTQSDFNSTNWLPGSGDNNYCENPNGWNDTSTIGCANTCKAKDIFDLVEMLEYLSGEKNLKYPSYCDLDDNRDINLFDAFTLIAHIVTGE